MFNIFVRGIFAVPRIPPKFLHHEFNYGTVVPLSYTSFNMSILMMKLYSNRRNSSTPIRQGISHMRRNHFIQTCTHITTSLIPRLFCSGKSLGMRLHNHGGHIDIALWLQYYIIESQHFCSLYWGVLSTTWTHFQSFPWLYAGRKDQLEGKGEESRRGKGGGGRRRKGVEGEQRGKEREEEGVEETLLTCTCTIGSGHKTMPTTVAVDYFMWQLYCGLATSVYYTNNSRWKFLQVYIT